ncbi:bifunctional [glutamine synthetase] adenylyltransferase/[glutamine synthetase]-adenylyl-L-tyrosine phosphorylase [Alloscardovia venturai]|uniref:Bifunctional [glutamine synthetase] adenylyltransferase/[glutamine synthetase]-adenylyl-L-tyrosine phosphorylase n=1 Tax=Alloscardovia venturai TaxID=1769421 RepID=A0ABW2Y603_9BIFI
MAEFSLTSSSLIRIGFNSAEQAMKDLKALDDLRTAVLGQGCTSSWTLDDVLNACKKVDDPDTAVWHVADIARNLSESNGKTAISLCKLFYDALPSEISRLLSICGSSDRLGRMICADMQLLPDALRGDDVHNDEIANSDTHSLTFEKQVYELRLWYWKNLLHIVGDDVTSDNPLDVQPHISQRLSTLIDTALRKALEIAQNTVDSGTTVKFAIFGMGKLGAQEINYISDVDLVYVVDKTPDFTGDLTQIGSHVASTLQSVCSAILPDVTLAPLWEIDTALRPEGKAGPLVRTVESYASYYAHWAENWEFQALLKARFVAGDADVAHDFLNLITPLIWSASSRKNFVYDCRSMRKRVEDLIPLDQKDREIKLGKGGLRDVEFTVQMLQLVHGRTDETLRTKSTLDSLALLSQGGYVSRSQARDLSEDYRFLRVLEHRQQLWNMRRTHLFPKISTSARDTFSHAQRVTDLDVESNRDIRRLARAVHMTPAQLVNHFDDVRVQVRQLHMDIYYRPMLPNLSQLSDDVITLSEKATRERFESVGFADPDTAMRHVHQLTAGVSRSSRINRILLPTILLWLGNGQNPDMGLMMWRRWVEAFGGSGPYLGFLRDSPTALQRMCHVLSNSRFLGDALLKSSESTTWLGDDDSLQPRSLESLHTRANVLLHRFPHAQVEFATLLRALRRREIERIGLGWMSSVVSSQEALTAMTRVYDVLIDTALTWATAKLCTDDGIDSPQNAPVHMAVIAMGRYGGQEVNFSSDADLMVVYEAAQGVDDVNARNFAQRQAELLRSVLTGLAGTEQQLDIDMDLRPEGKNGPLVRSVQSYREYYSSWAETWEKQALLRARYAAGDAKLGERFIAEVINPIRYSSQKMSEDDIHSIQRLKARMEAERLPRGVRYDRHIKLGRGGLSDVEWTIQLLQLEHAHEWEDVRTTRTLDALDALKSHGAISPDDATTLQHCWTLCTDMRNANFLWNGRTRQADIIPDDSFDMGGLSACLGFGAHRGQQFMDEVLSAMRKCRDVTNRLFYGRQASHVA